MSAIPKVSSFRDAAALRARLRELGVEIPLDAEILSRESSPLAAPIDLAPGLRAGNRWCIQPMEGWDGSPSGGATELVARRWRRFGESGAKLIWGCEAVAVLHEGRANPRQLLFSPENRAGLAGLLADLRAAHRTRHGGDADLVVGLQLTHSGRFSRPDADRPLAPRILYHHPVLDRRFGGCTDAALLTDGEIGRIIEAMVAAARGALELGFEFVDVKHCHGYLGHEFLTAVDRPGRYGGDLENRLRFLAEVVAGIRRDAPGLRIGVRLSAFDTVPYRAARLGEAAEPGLGIPEPAALAAGEYRYGLGVDPRDPLRLELGPTVEIVRRMRELGVDMFNLTAGSPYYNPHIQRPALYPPSDGYSPPEDPLVGVARQIDAARQVKAALPELPVVGTAYSYLQEFLPHAAQAVVRAGWADAAGIGRMALAYHDLPDDVLRRGRLDRRRLCRTFSDCTTAPRNGLVSGCYPLDEFYRRLPERKLLNQVKHEAETRRETGTGAAARR